MFKDTLEDFEKQTKEDIHLWAQEKIAEARSRTFELVFGAFVLGAILGGALTALVLR